MLAVIQSQLELYPQRLAACWRSDKGFDTSGIWGVGVGLGWREKNEEDFARVFGGVFKAPKEMTEEDLNGATNGEELKIFMKQMVAANELVERTCQRILMVNKEHLNRADDSRRLAAVVPAIKGVVVDYGV